jgi:putative transposase
MDETYLRIKGKWVYLYRAVDKYGKTIDFLLTQQRDKKAARRFLNKAMSRHGVPDKITLDGSDANASAITSYNADHGTSIEIRQIKYLNHIVEQDHRGVKRVTGPMLGFKAFDAAQNTLTGIELVRMIRKGQMEGGELEGLSAAEQFNALASIILPTGDNSPQCVNAAKLATYMDPPAMSRGSREENTFRDRCSHISGLSVKV